MAFRLTFWVWFFLTQPYDLPERVVGADLPLFRDYIFDSWPGRADAFPEEVRVEDARIFRDPQTLHAICEEYRAATTVGSQHDEADRGQRRITCLALVLWSRQGALQVWYDVLALGRDGADDVRGRALDCGHFPAEDAADETYTELSAILTT